MGHDATTVGPASLLTLKPVNWVAGPIWEKAVVVETGLPSSKLVPVTLKY